MGVEHQPAHVSYFVNDKDPGSLLKNQDSMESFRPGFFFVAHVCFPLTPFGRGEESTDGLEGPPLDLFWEETKEVQGLMIF